MSLSEKMTALCTVFTDVVVRGIIAWNNPFVGWAEVCEDGMHVRLTQSVSGSTHAS